MPESELDRIDPTPERVTLSTGLTVEVVRLKTRQFFRLLKILTHGAGPAVMKAGLDFNAGAEQFAQGLVMLVVMSIPDAEQEAVGFLQSMCQPAGLASAAGRKATKQEAEDDKAAWDRFNTDMFNPDPGDTLDLVEVIVRREAPELQALGKKLKSLMDLYLKTGQDTKAEPVPDQAEMAQNSPEPSPPSSTFSPTPTDGPTSTSSIFPSAVSVSAPRQQGADETLTYEPA